MDRTYLQFCFGILIFLMVLEIFTLVSCVKINRLSIPEIASPDKIPIILDCDYSLEFPRDEGLVVKWFFNERLYPVYQWIPDAKPQELGVLKNRLDLNHKASEDRYKVHRALKIVKLSPDLAGNYTCSVSTFSSEDSQTKRMLVFVPEKSLELKYPPLLYRDADNPKVVCYAEGVFPKPQLRLLINDSEVENAPVTYQEKPSGLFDVEICTTGEFLTDGTSILCELHVAMTNYTVKKEAIYYGARSTTSTMLSATKCIYLWLVSLFLIILTDFQLFGSF